MKRATGIGLAALVVLLAQVAWAFSYYAPTPQGRVGLSRPTIVQQLVLEPGEQIWRAQLSVDGVTVQAQWDASGRVFYTPDQPLKPGLHEARLTVDVSSGQPNAVYPPLVQEFSFTVDEHALDLLPTPNPEQLRAMARVNRWRSAAGLAPFTYSDALGAAAAGHASYLAANPAQIADVHHEQAGRLFFFGVQPHDRAKYFGYGDSNAEVINFVARAEEAVDGWMATLYHRLPLIYPGNREMGYGLAFDGSTRYNVLEAGPLAHTGKVVQWPYPGQKRVPRGWSGLEVPDPLRLYPRQSGPLGYTISLTFGQRVKSLSLTAAALKGPEGAVAVMRFDPVRDDQLDDTVAIIPVRPLRADSAYTVAMSGTVDFGQGPQPYDYNWFFETGGYLEVTSRVVTTLGDTVTELAIEGQGFGEGLLVYLDGLPVPALRLESDSRATFGVPQGYSGGRADLLVVSGDGQEAVWTDFFIGGESVRFSPSPTPFTQLPLSVGGKPYSSPALRHRSGTILLPDTLLESVGWERTQLDENDRTYWSKGTRTGEYTRGYVGASVDEIPLGLAMPVRMYGGGVFVPAEFMRELAGATVTAGPEGVAVEVLLEGMSDIATHWAREAIARLVAAGIVSGYGDTTFRPEVTLTRAAFLKMLVGARSMEPVPGDAGGFADTQGHWVAQQGYLGPAVRAGFVLPSDYPAGRFEPDRAITREEIAVMVARALGREAEAAQRRVTLVNGAAEVGGKLFSDAAQWSRPGYVAETVEQGIVTGYAEEDGSFTFRPLRLATRAEAAVMTVRALEKE